MRIILKALSLFCYSKFLWELNCYKWGFSCCNCSKREHLICVSDFLCVRVIEWLKKRKRQSCPKESCEQLVREKEFLLRRGKECLRDCKGFSTCEGANPSGLRNPQVRLRQGRRQEAEPCKSLVCFLLPLTLYLQAFHYTVHFI